MGYDPFTKASKYIGNVFTHIGDVVTDKAGREKKEREAEQAKAKAAKDSDRAYTMATDEIDFQRKQYDDWKSIYGPLQEDIGTYFKNITGGKIAAHQIQNIQQEYQAAQQNVDTQLAQRGLTNSGLAAQTLVSNNMQAAQAKATARTNADTMAQQQKMGFLGLGLGQGTSMLGINAQASNTGVNSSLGSMSNYTNMYNTNQNNLTRLQAQNMANMPSYINQGTDIAGAIGGFLFSDIRLKDSLILVKTVKGINFYEWKWNYIANGLGLSGTGFGVIAQEVVTQIPNSVGVDEKSGYYTVNYDVVYNYLGEI